jgi:integrase
MRKPKYPRGVTKRGMSLVVSFALADGTIERRTIGPLSVTTIEEAKRKQLNFKEQVRLGTYEKVKPAPLPSPAKPVYTVADLWEPYIVSYRNNEGRDEDRLKIAWEHLKTFKLADGSTTLGTVPVGDVTTALVGEYIAARKAAGMKAGTINRETATLRAMMNHGAKITPPMVERMPTFPKRLKESAPRKGFTTDAEYTVLAANAKQPWLRALLAVGYTYGFRKGELLMLRVEQVDLLNREIGLGHNTKTGEPRLVSMTAEVYELMRVSVRGKNPNDYVFTREDGSRVVDFREDWYTLCVESKLGRYVSAKRKNGKDYKRYEGLNVHDLRRSAIRAMVRAGIPERVCMDISGHATRSVFDRYNIIDKSDIVRASEQLEQARKAAVAESKTDTKLTHAEYAHS